MSKKIKVVMCPVDRPPYVTNISDTLENMQKTVGGYIETVTIATNVVLVCNEEGRLIGLSDNPSLRTLVSGGIRGNAFFCGRRRDALVGLTDKAAGMLLAMVKRSFAESDAKAYKEAEKNG